MVTPEMNQDITRMITKEEVCMAVMDIGAHQAPGLDGFTAVFYHNYWEDVKDDIMTEVCAFFETGQLDQQLCHNNICLIPKVYPPNGMKEFRPIAVCNVSYKIITKVLVNRLKKHLGNIFSKNQNAFIPGRMISDNIVVVHEVFHNLKVRKRQATSYMDVKTYITKAYDMLEMEILIRDNEAHGV
ncbi:hypothetical protein YC2023_051538 [Brassica napus]